MSVRTALVAAAWSIAVVGLHAIPRAQFELLLSAYSAAFVLYLGLIARTGLTLRQGLVLALCVRFAGFFFLPQWSDDYYRFVWDGMLAHHGINPMACTPEEIMRYPGNPPADEHLFQLLNHTAYHSVYPPVAQAIFRISYALNGSWLAGHVIFFKFILLLADAGIAALLIILLRGMDRPARYTLVYVLNPLVILECTGNLHMEGLMILGLLGAAGLGLHGRPLASLGAMAFSVLAKLVTLVLAPFLPGTMAGQRWLPYMTLLVLLVSSGLLISFNLEMAWLQSVRLWFQTFEFNAGLYYLLRWAGYQLTGYNAIYYIGPGMALLSLLGIGALWWRFRTVHPKQWPVAMTLALTVYFLLGTTIHPWYLTTVLATGVLAGFFYPLAWSYLAIFSYSHYSGGGFQEHYGWIAFEYGALAAIMCIEWRRYRI